MIRHSLFRAYLAAAIVIAYALALLLAFGSMCRAEPNRGLAGVVWALALEEDVDPAPPDPEVCENCDGRGWLGDGQPRADCPDCETEWDNYFDARPTADWQPYSKAAYAAALKAGKPIIWRFDSDNCRNCEAMHRLHAAGKVAKVLSRDYTLLVTNISRKGSPHKGVNVKATPTELVIDPKRNAIVRRWRGAVKTPAQYFERLLLSTIYPVERSKFWTGCSGWQHLNTASEHRGKFDSAWLRQLTDDELQELHSDDHEGVVQWQHVVRKETR